MGRKKRKDSEALKHKIFTRVNDETYKKLTGLLSQHPTNDMSCLLRTILTNRPVKVFVHDQSMDLLMEELASIRKEINVIGMNVNQIAKLFNTYTAPQQKAFFARIGYKEYLRLESKIDRTIELIGILGKKWLSGES